MSSLKIDKNGAKISLSGFLDENSDLKSLEAMSGPVTISFKGVTRVNSCGVREWVNLVQKAASAKMTYDECPLVVVKQLNAVPDFAGKANVGTFFAPYFCESCDEDQVKLITAKDVKGGKPPELKCETCKNPLSFDAIPNQYFSFLKRLGAGE